MRALQEVITAMQGGQWEEAYALYNTAKTAWQELRNTHDIRWVPHTPCHLLIISGRQDSSVVTVFSQP